MTYYGILGIDPIAQNTEEFGLNKEEPENDLITKVPEPEDDKKSNQAYQIKAKFGLDDHAFGLDHQLFTTKHEFEQHHHTYQEEVVDKIKGNIKMREAQAKDIRAKRLEEKKKVDDEIN